jgi:flagellar export protein FliJ
VTKKAKLHFLGRVRDARKRLRDAAANDLAAAEAEQFAADERHNQASAHVDQVRDGVSDRLHEVRSVRALWTFEHEHRVAVGLREEAKVAVEVARDESQRYRSHLVLRARELKTAEKVIDRTQTGLRHDEKRAEQKSNDDLTGSRTGRRD